MLGGRSWPRDAQLQKCPQRGQRLPSIRTACCAAGRDVSENLIIAIMVCMRPAFAAKFRSFLALPAALVLVPLNPARAEASIDQAQAASIFQQADTICNRAAGAMRGQTLSAPMPLFIPHARSVASNH